jgi:uncharacterized RDD family membrane protein YckC
MAYEQPPAAAGYQDVGPYAQVAYANWLYRVGSFLVDAVVVSAAAWIGLFLTSVLGMRDANGGMSGAGLAITLVAELISLGVLIWNAFIRQGRTGQSVGKQVLGTKLVSLQTGQPIGAGMAFLRQLCHILDALPCYLGYLWPLWDSRRQTFADKIVSSVVVRA